MIKILFNKDIQKVIIKNFSQVYNIFQDTKDLLLKYGCSYNKKDKNYKCSPFIYEDLIIELKDIDEVEVHPYTEKLIQEAISIPLQIKKYRPYFEEGLLKYPPLIGKHPYENFQIEDIKLLSSYNRFGCFWIMGAGKSFCIAYMLTFLFQYNKIDHAVILTPPDGLINLKLEILKFSSLFKEEDFFIATRFNKEIFNQNNYKILMCTYTTWLVLNKHFYLQTEINKKRRKFKTIEEIKKKMPKCFGREVIDFNKYWGNNNKLIILDESHLISNPKSKISKYLHLYKNLFEYRYLFSGTPADVYEKWYSQIKFLDETLIPKTYVQWLLEIAVLGNRFSATAINKYKPDKVDQFLNKISSYVVQRGREVLDIPENIIKKNYVELTEDQKQIYQYLIDMEMFNQDQQYHEIDFGKIFNSFPYLIQALDNPCLLKDKLENKFNYPNIEILSNLIKEWKFENHPKLEITNYLLHKYIKEENRKMILWSYHPLTINQLTEYYKKYNPLYIHGDIDIPAKEKIGIVDTIVNQFKNDKNYPLLIASSKVLQRAKTITEATRQIYFDRSFSFTEFNQSGSRIYRQGTIEPIITNILIFINSLDIHLDKIIEKKSNINKSLLSKKYLTINEIKAMFEGKELDIL